MPTTRSASQAPDAPPLHPPLPNPVRSRRNMPTVTNPPPPADPGNDPDDPPTNPPTNPPPVPRRSISPELRELLGAGRSVSVRPPDTFDGSDQKKLQNFLLLLSIFFQSQPRRFSTDQHKVLFAISYLKGTPLDYFGPGIQAADLGEPEPLWLDDYRSLSES